MRRPTFRRSLVRSKDLDIDTILEKKHIIRKSGILSHMGAMVTWVDWRY